MSQQTRIKVRSPYYLKYTNASLSYVDLNVYVYSGGQSAFGGSDPQYTLKKYVRGSETYVVFEVAELIRDYIETAFDGTYDNEPKWVYTQATLRDVNGSSLSTSNAYFYAYDGYTLFEEGINYTTDTPVFITDRVEDSNSEVTIYRPSGQSIKIPVNADNADGNGTGWFYKLIEPDGSDTQTSVSSSGNTSEQIKYISVNSTYNKVEIWEEPPGVGVETLRYTIHIEEMECNKYDVIKVTFYNRWGALQDLFFTAKHRQSLTVSDEKYKSNLIDFNALSYSATRHQTQSFNKQGVEKIIMNTGIVNEDYSIWLKELMLSENVWMTKNSTVYPIRILSKNLLEKTSINNKTFSYSIEAEYAFEKVQNVR